MGAGQYPRQLAPLQSAPRRQVQPTDPQLSTHCELHLALALERVRVQVLGTTEPVVPEEVPDTVVLVPGMAGILNMGALGAVPVALAAE